MGVPCDAVLLCRRYFHAYRIDHILGFFRIWEIPADCCSGILGRFRPSLPLTRHVRHARPAGTLSEHSACPGLPLDRLPLRWLRPQRGPPPKAQHLSWRPTQQCHRSKGRDTLPLHTVHPSPDTRPPTHPNQELESRGIWDFDRLCEPWITDDVLRDTFGAELAPEVAARYLQEQVGGRYRFRKMYAR